MSQGSTRGEIPQDAPTLSATISMLRSLSRLPLSRTKIVLAMLVGYWGAMFIATHIPVAWMLAEGSSASRSLSQGGDKPIHLLAYAGLSFLLMTFASVRGDNSPKKYRYAAMLCCLYAVFDELSQIPVGRTADVWDCLADWIGVGVGLMCHGVLLRVIAMVRSPEKSASAA